MKSTVHVNITHYLKVAPRMFAPLHQGQPIVEYRDGDRGYRPGQRACLMEYDARAGRFTGRHADATITAVLRGPDGGLPKGRVAISLSPLVRTEALP